MFRWWKDALLQLTRLGLGMKRWGALGALVLAGAVVETGCLATLLIRAAVMLGAGGSFCLSAFSVILAL